MDNARLVTIPLEMIRMLSSYLSLEEVEALSETCVHIYNVLNDDSVWRRFLPEHAHNLDTQTQQLDPPFEPNPDFCRNRQLVSMLKHLLSNWHDDRFVEYSTSTELSPYRKQDGSFYKENYFIGCRRAFFLRAIEVWDVSKEPVLHSTLPLNKEWCTDYFIFDQNLVVTVCCRVDVYKINIESKNFLLLYSYVATEDKSGNERAFVTSRESNHCDDTWAHTQVENYLVTTIDQLGKQGAIPLVFHIWDIANARKVGTFVSPWIGSVTAINSLQNGDWLVHLYFPSKNFFSKFNVKSQMFSDFPVEYDYFSFRKMLVYMSYMIIFAEYQNEDDDQSYVAVCQLYDCSHFTMKHEKRFEFSQGLTLPRTVENGKFIIQCDSCLLEIDALTLETLNSVPCESSQCFEEHLEQFYVYGSAFAMVTETHNQAYFWNIEKKRKLRMPYPEGSYVSSVVNKTRTKLLILENFGRKIHLKHFW